MTLSNGSVLNVVAVVNPDGTLTYEFFVGGGIPQGNGEYLGNGFGYANGKLKAFYQPIAGSGRPSYTLTATIGTVVTLPRIDANFSMIAFTLTNIQIVLGNGQTQTFKQGRYYQGVYTEGSAQGDAPGGIVLEQ